MVLAIGNPFGVGQTVTHGIVSAVARTQVGISDYQFFIQTDAAINPGNSGGALVDMAGRLVGINTAIFSRSGGSKGIGFAIPANMVRVVVASARSGGSAVKRPWLGAKLQAVTPEIVDGVRSEAAGRRARRQRHRERPGGARRAARPATSSSRSTGRRSTIPMPSTTASRRKPLGGKAELGVVRARQAKARSPSRCETAPETPRDEIVIEGRSPFTGAKVANLSPALADELRLDSATDGVVVVEVADGTPAQQFGFQRGDVVLAVNGRRSPRPRDLDKVAKAGAGCGASPSSAAASRSRPCSADDDVPASRRHGERRGITRTGHANAGHRMLAQARA